MALLDAVARFVGRSIYEGKSPAQVGVHIRSAAVERIRELLGGNLSAPPYTQLEWFLEEVDEAREAADKGDLTLAGQLLRPLRGDALISGLLRTKAGGTIRLPKKWAGEPDIIEDLTSADVGSISNFDLLCPPSELQAMAEDADFLRVAYGELVPVDGREFPVLRRRDPELLFYNWATGRWYYRSNAGIIEIDPGDGNHVLHIAGPLTAPWQHGSWLALGRTWCRKDGCQHLKSRWEYTLANPARVAHAPAAATKEQRLSHFQQVMAWGVATVFGLPPGWDVTLLESKGEGWQGFDSSIKSYNEEIMIALAGQLVSITGGTGFSSEDLYASVRYDLIRDTAVPLAFTLNTQVIPAYVYMTRGEAALDNCPSFEFVVKRPDDLKAEAAVYTALGQGLKQIIEVARSEGIDVDVVQLLTKFGIQAAKSSRTQQIKIDLAPADVAKCFTVDEVRASRAASPLGDERGAKLLSEIQPAKAEPEKTEGGAGGDSSTVVKRAAMRGKSVAYIRPMAGNFKEEDHPRSDDGKFGSGGGGSDKEDKKSSQKHGAPKVRTREDLEKEVPKDKNGKQVYEGFPLATINKVHEFSGETGLKAVIFRKDRNGKEVQTYKYTDQHEQQHADAKFAKAARMAEHHDQLIAQVEKDSKSENRKTADAAVVVRLIDATTIRVGGSDSEKDTGSVGATTLRAEHVSKNEDGSVSLKFPGKSGKAWDRRIEGELAKELWKRTEGKDPSERVFGVSASDVNGYLAGASPDKITAKDFRTFHASALSFAILSEKAPPPTISAKQAEANIKEAIEQTAKHLGNTPAICKERYINPRVLDEYRNRVVTTSEKKAA